MSIADFFRPNEIKKLKNRIQALEEGQHGDVLTPSITGATISDSVVDKNNYKTYSSQVTAINDMYNNKADYGSDLLRDLIDTRVSFIGGGGVSIISKRKKTVDWNTNFLKYNRLMGSRLLEIIKISEMEGKCLLNVEANKSKNNIDVRSYSWYSANYNIEMDEKNNNKVKSATYTRNMMSGAAVAPADRIVYVKTGGTPDSINETPPKIANCLNDIDSISRAKFDLRKNNHLFAKVMPYFKTEDRAEAKAINQAIKKKEWSIGMGYAGTADFSLIGPPLGAIESITREILERSRNISRNTSIPIHWMAYPDVMSNRATAENMLEVINSGTIQERMIWEEALYDLILKAMELAYSLGMKGAIYDPDFEVRLSLISYANLKQIQETWIPLADAGFVSVDTVRSIIPGINPTEEKKLIEKEKEENIERFQKSSMENENNEGDEEEEKNEEDNNT